MKHEDANILIRRAVGYNIRSLRKSSAYNQDQFAELIHVTRSYVSQTENGKTNITVGLLAKIADGLDVPITALFRGVDECAPSRLSHNVTHAVIGLPNDPGTEDTGSEG